LGFGVWGLGRSVMVWRFGLRVSRDRLVVWVWSLLFGVEGVRFRSWGFSHGARPVY